MIDQSLFFIFFRVLQVYGLMTHPRKSEKAFAFERMTNTRSSIVDRVFRVFSPLKSLKWDTHGPNCVSAPTSNPDPLFSSRIFSSRKPRGKTPDQQLEKNISSNRRKLLGPKPSSARSSFSASRADRVFFIREFRLSRAIACAAHSFPHEQHLPVNMAAMSAVAPVLNKAPVVSTGKAANTNSMMVWQPHGNK